MIQPQTHHTVIGQILAALSENDTLTALEIGSNVEVSLGKMYAELRGLEQEGVVQRERSGQYSISDTEKADTYLEEFGVKNQ